MITNLTLGESVVRYALALTLSVVALSSDLAPQWTAAASFATCYLAFTAMLMSDPVYALFNAITRAVTRKPAAVPGANAPVPL